MNAEAKQEIERLCAEALHAELEDDWKQAFAALCAAGLEADADDPIAARYRAASDAVNHSNRRRDWAIATGRRAS